MSRYITIDCKIHIETNKSRKKVYTALTRGIAYGLDVKNIAPPASGRWVIEYDNQAEAIELDCVGDFMVEKIQTNGNQITMIGENDDITLALESVTTEDMMKIIKHFL